MQRDPSHEHAPASVREKAVGMFATSTPGAEVRAGAHWSSTYGRSGVPESNRSDATVTMAAGQSRSKTFLQTSAVAVRRGPRNLPGNTGRRLHLTTQTITYTYLRAPSPGRHRGESGSRGPYIYPSVPASLRRLGQYGRQAKRQRNVKVRGGPTHVCHPLAPNTIAKWR